MILYMGRGYFNRPNAAILLAVFCLENFRSIRMIRFMREALNFGAFGDKT